MKSKHGITKALLLCAATAILATAAGCDTPRGEGETHSAADSIIVARRAGYVGGWRGGVAYRGGGYAVGYPVAGRYGYGPYYY